MKTKKILALMAALMMSSMTVTAFGSCGGGQEIIDSNYDVSKAYVTVGTYDGGVGRAWLDEAAKRFEKLHENTMFGDKKGVQVSVDADKVNYGGDYLSKSNLTRDIYFTEGVDYYSFVNNGKAADISDIVTGSLSSFGESGTIEGKLDSMFKSYLTAKDGKYYMLPFYDGFYGFVYDVELFEEESFYFDDEGAFIGVAKDADAAEREAFETAKSNGPDGKANTYDDGLPATYEQMLELVDQIKFKGYIPFCYAGSTEYVDKAFRSYVVDYEGYEGMNVNYTLSGKANVVTNINGNTVTTEEITVSPEDAYKLQKQAGKYYALYMEEKLFGSTAYVGQFNEDSHTTAQRTFINSKYASSGRYAMLAEGAWWENEAELANAFSGVEKRADRRFAFLPVPKADSSRAGDQTMISLNNSYAFINKDSQNMEAAKEFMRFLHTDAEMSKFTAKTSITRSLNYSILEADRSTATNFGKSLIDMRSQSKVVYPYSSVKLVLDNADAFSEVKWFATTRVGSNEITSPMLAFQAENPVSAENYFKGLFTYQENQWKILKR